MSYSDYGGFCWKNGERFTDGEDGTLVGITAQKERPLEEATGMKLDVLVNAYAQQGANYGNEKDRDKVDYLTGHPHHVVVGEMEGLAIIAHKQSVWFLYIPLKCQKGSMLPPRFELGSSAFSKLLMKLFLKVSERLKCLTGLHYRSIIN